jgi:lysophospholipase L1-like esterase
MFKRRPVLRLIAEAAIAALLVAGAAWAGIQASHRLPSTDATTATEQPNITGPLIDRPPVLLVIGDSLAGGVNDPGILKEYPDVLGDKLGMEVTTDAMGARGFLPTYVPAVNATVPPFIDRLQYDKDHSWADYIVIDGGRNDLGKDPRLVAPSIDHYFTQLRAAYPQAKIVALVPSYISPKLADNYRFLLEGIQFTAQKNGIYVFDPVAEGWYRDVDLDPLLWRDDVHLNAAGAEFYAEKIAADMRRAGLVPNEPAGAGTN